MTFSLAAQTLVFLQSILLGAASGLWYDVCRAVRRTGRAGSFGTALTDLLFWLTALGALFYFAVTDAAAQMRGYVLLGEGLGALLYFLCFSPLLLPLMCAVLHCAGLLLCFPVNLGRRISIFAEKRLDGMAQVAQFIKRLKKKLSFLKHSG